MQNSHYRSNEKIIMNNLVLQFGGLECLLNTVERRSLSSIHSPRRAEGQC